MTREYKLQHWDGAAWVDMDHLAWRIERGIGRNLLAPLMKFAVDIDEKVDANTLVRLRVIRPGTTDVTLFEGHTVSGGEISRSGEVKYEARHPRWRDMDRVFNLIDPINAIRLEGTPDLAVMTDENLITTDKGGISFWFRTSAQGSNPGLDAGPLLVFADATERGLFVGIEDNGNIYFRLVDSDDTALDIRVTAADYADGEWHFCMILWDFVDDDLYNLIVDGDSNGGTTTGSALRHNANCELNFGRDPISDEYQDMLLDDVRLFDSYLTIAEEDEVRQAHGSYATTDHETHLWRLNEGTGTEARDAYDNILMSNPEAKWTGLTSTLHTLLGHVFDALDIPYEIWAGTPNPEIDGVDLTNVKLKEFLQDMMDRTGTVFFPGIFGDYRMRWMPEAFADIGVQDVTAVDTSLDKFEEGELDTIINRVIIYTPNAPSDFQEASDAGSIAAYGERTKIYNVEYITEDAEALAMASALVDRWKDPESEATIIVGGGLYIDTMMYVNQTVTIVHPALGIDELMLIEEQIMSEGRSELRLGKASSWGRQNEAREMRSNRWKT